MVETQRFVKGSGLCNVKVQLALSGNNVFISKMRASVTGFQPRNVRKAPAAMLRQFAVRFLSAVDGCDHLSCYHPKSFSKVDAEDQKPSPWSRLANQLG
jgi:hypothetical protein